MENELAPLVWHTEQRKWSELIPWEHNPRRVTEAQVAILRESILETNVTRIPIIDVDNVIVGGHALTSLMLSLGRGDEITDVRVPNRKLSFDEFKRINVRDNISNGDFNFDELGNMFDVDELRGLGFDERDLSMFKGDENVEFDLPDGDKDELEQITFTLSAVQAETIRDAIEFAKTTDEFIALDKTVNENSNGNALYVIALLCRQKN